MDAIAAGKITQEEIPVDEKFNKRHTTEVTVEGEAKRPASSVKVNANSLARFFGEAIWDKTNKIYKANDRFLDAYNARQLKAEGWLTYTEINDGRSLAALGESHDE